MKYLFGIVVLSLWLIATILLAISLIGIIIVGDSSWYDLPKKVISIIENDSHT